MKRSRTEAVSAPEIALPIVIFAMLCVQGLLGAQQPAPAGDGESVVSRTLRIVEQHQKELERIGEAMSPEYQKLDDALRAVDSAYADTAIPERERLARAAQAKDAVLASLDAILDREAETKRLFGAQIDALRGAWARAAGDGALRAEAGTTDVHREQRKEVAAAIALDPATPPEWRELFQMAFELLELDEAGMDELSAQEQAMMQETLAALDAMRKEFYLSYAEQARAFHALRSLRRSEALQKDLLISAKDLEALREVGLAAREGAKRLLKRDAGGSTATTKVIRELLDRLQKGRGKPMGEPRSKEQQKRSMQEYAARLRDRVAKAGG